MKKNIRASIKDLIPKSFWDIISIDDVEQYLIGDLNDVQVNECSCTLTLKKKASAKDVQLSKCETPTVDEVLPEFLIKLKKQNLDSKAQRILILTRSKKGISFSELKHIEQQIEGIANTVPIIFVTRTLNQNDTSIQCLVATGKPQKRGSRLAYDLDGSLTRWPKQFAGISRSNKEAKGFNLVISTRHEPRRSSCFQDVYDREKQGIEDTGVDMDVLAHAWLDFDLMEKLFPFFDTSHWFDRCLWAKAFYCRLYRIDAYYADGQGNIDQLANFAPDLRTINVSASSPPATTFASGSKGSAEQTMIHAAVCKTNDFRVKDLSHSGAMPCNLRLELNHFSLQQHRTSFIQHFPRQVNMKSDKTEIRDLTRDFPNFSLPKARPVCPIEIDVTGLSKEEKYQRGGWEELIQTITAAWVKQHAYAAKGTIWAWGTPSGLAFQS